MVSSRFRLDKIRGFDRESTFRFSDTGFGYYIAPRTRTAFVPFLTYFKA